jgi:D-glycero-D-manno-heptose 1,7-bisphosphate phosphatase
MTVPRGVVFLDRDNTIVADPGYLHDPGQVTLLPDAAEGVGALHRAGWPVVIVSNQSGMARGLFGPKEFEAVNARMRQLLGPAADAIVATYHCPHHPDFTGPCECRKPGVKLFREAAIAHHIALGDSWFLGDRWTDVEPARTLGGRGLLVNADPLSEHSRLAATAGIRTVPTLLEAARLIGPRR